MVERMAVKRSRPMGNTSQQLDSLPNVLFIGKRYYTNRDALLEKYGRIYNLPKLWSDLGIRIHLWLIDYHSGKKVQGSEQSLSFTSSPIGAFSTIKQLVLYILFRHKLTHVVASGDSYIGLLGYFIAKRNKAVFIFDVYDKYDEFSGYISPPGLNLFSFLLKRADKRLFASKVLLEQLGYPALGDLIVVNGLEANIFLPRDIDKCRKSLGLPGDAVFIGYFGSMEPDRGVQDLIDAISQLRSNGVLVELLVGGKKYPDVDLDVEGVRYVGNVPFRQMPRMLAACNLIAIPYRRSSFMDSGSSNKIVEALACRRPIVATKTPNLTANFPLLAKALKGRLAEPGNVNEIAQVIVDQIEDPIVGDAPVDWNWDGIARKTAIELSLLSDVDEVRG